MPSIPVRRRSFLVALFLLSVSAAPGRAAQPADAITLAVDATDAPLKIFHSKLVFPAKPGPFSLSYPKWIPGEHGPTGPLTDVAGLHIMAGGRELAWERDLVDMHTIRCMVPEGAQRVEVAFDFISAASPQGFSSAASVTPELLLLSWNQLLLYPSGRPSDDLSYVASLRLPAGWNYGTALPVARESGGAIEFAPASLTTLVDSPVLAGAYFRRIPLTPGATPAHYLDMACDAPAGLELKDGVVAAYRRLLAEAYALFGARHYRDYHFLVSLSDHIAHFGLEHHESSDDRSWERAFVDDDLRIASSNLLPHELVHSWNGKYRRPADLATPDFQQPMKDDLLWVYEGLTQYLGFVLAARSGVRTLQQAKENLALQAATLDHQPGRTWRPLVDTAVEAQLLYEAPAEWESWRRGTDFYNEGLLIWLDADVTIRRLTQGRRSLDDFCHRFHGPPSGPPRVVTYTFDDVVGALDAVAPSDWRAFFDTRLHSLSPHAPLGGVTGSGWHVAYSDSVPGYLKALEAANKYVDVSFSLGFHVKQEDAEIVDVIPGSPAAKAGIGPGMKLVAVNGRQWSKDVLRDAIRGSKKGTGTIEILVSSGEFFRTCRIAYRDGERYPVLERDRSKPDLLSEILRPHAGR